MPKCQICLSFYTLKMFCCFSGNIHWSFTYASLVSCQNRTNILKIWLIKSRFPLLPERIAVYVKTTWFNLVWSNILCDTQALYASKYIVCRCVYDISFKMLHFKVFLWTHLELYNSISFVHVCEFWNILKIDHINFSLIYSLKCLFSEFSPNIFFGVRIPGILLHIQIKIVTFYRT